MSHKDLLNLAIPEDREACNQFGMLLLNSAPSFDQPEERNECLQKAYTYFERSAKLGDPEGMRNLGWRYILGEGTNTDIEKGIEWFIKSRSPAPEWLNRLGMLLLQQAPSSDGEERQKFLHNAFLLFEMASLSDPEAMWNLGWRYWLGEGVLKDISMAVKCWQHATEKNHQASINKISSLEKIPYTPSVAVAYQKQETLSLTNIRADISREVSKLSIEKAKEIVEDFSKAHFWAASLIGLIPFGQFGLDRIVLTSLTISMINQICNEFHIEDNKARAIHIFSALARLTIKGTTLALTLLSVVPGGSFVNGTVTFFLTRKAGQDCIDDIVKNKMNPKGQLEQVLRRGASQLISSYMGNVLHESLDINSLNIDILEPLLDNSQMLSSLMQDTNLHEYAKTYIALLITDTSKQLIEKGKVNFKEAVQDTLFGLLGSALFADQVKAKDGFLLTIEDKQIVLEQLKSNHSTFLPFIDQQIEILEQVSEERKGKIIKDIASEVAKVIKLVKGGNLQKGKIIYNH